MFPRQTYRVIASHEPVAGLKLESNIGRVKAMTNLDSVLKSRDITLPEKISIVKAIVLPVVTYRCETWIIMKAEG